MNGQFRFPVGYTQKVRTHGNMVPILYGARVAAEENRTGNRTINPAAGHFTD